MSQSAFERELLYDRENQAVHQEADAICKDIERNIGTWQEVLAEAEKKSFELREELAGARKKRLKRSKQLAEAFALIALWTRRE